MPPKIEVTKELLDANLDCLQATLMLLEQYAQKNEFLKSSVLIKTLTSWGVLEDDAQLILAILLQEGRVKLFGSMQDGVIVDWPSR